MLLFALLLQAAQPAPPSLHGDAKDMTCPVGGERFSAWHATMYSTNGARPDGKPYSYLPFPLPIPECPGNKLIVFDEFSAAETAALARLIETSDYKKLIETETTYYRGYWLATQVGRPKPQALGMLLSAIWQVSPSETSDATALNGGARLRRYQETFVGEVRQLGPAVEAKDRIWLEARAANAARQMMRFDDAERLRQQAERSLATAADKRGWDSYLAELQRVIARADARVEPLDMIPVQQVAGACARERPSNDFDRAACASPAVSARMAH